MREEGLCYIHIDVGLYTDGKREREEGREGKTSLLNPPLRLHVASGEEVRGPGRSLRSVCWPTCQVKVGRGR